MSFSRVKQYFYDLENKKDILDIKQVIAYEKITNELPFDAKTEKYKATIILIIFAIFNTFENFKIKKIRTELKTAKDNYSRFYIFKENFKTSKINKKHFFRDLKIISRLLKSNLTSEIDNFEKHISFFFPQICIRLDDDFKSLQETIFLSQNKLFDDACILLQDTLTHTTMDFVQNLFFHKHLQSKDISQTNKNLLMSLLSLNYNRSNLLLQNIKIFLSFPEVKLLANQNNKCIEIIKEFRNKYKNDLIQSSLKFKILGPGLSISKNDHSECENFMVLLHFLLYAGRYFKTIKNYSHKDAGLLMKRYEKIFSEKSLLVLLHECHCTYTEIRTFLLDMGTGQLGSKELSQVSMSEFIKNLLILFDNSYFLTLMFGYHKRKYSDIYGVLMAFLVRKTRVEIN